MNAKGRKRSNASSRGISGTDYINAENDLLNHFNCSSIPEDEILEQTSLFVTPQHKRREIFFYEIYKLIIERPGSIVQFGVRWGRELALFETLRVIFEPFNHSRKIIGFDTFSGYPNTAAKESNELLKPGGLNVSEKYEEELQKILLTREKLSPLPQAKKFELVKGNVEKTLPKYLEKNPHQLFSLVHLDLNLGSATKFALEHIYPRTFKGSIVVIDEICHPKFPGETTALSDVLELTSLRLKRIPYLNTTWQSYFEVE